MCSRADFTAIATPSGWFEVIRGPHPPAVQWPVPPRGKGRARAPRSQRQPPQSRGKSSQSRSPKGKWHQSRRRSGLWGQKTLSRKRRMRRSRSERGSVQIPRRSEGGGSCASCIFGSRHHCVGKSRRAGQEVSRGSSREGQEECQRGSSRSEVEFHRAASEEIDDHRRQDFQEGRRISAIAISMCRGDGKFGVSKARLESLRAEVAAATDVPVPPMNVEAEFRRMQGVIDRAASGGGPVQIQRGRCRNRGRRGRGIIHRFGARQKVSEVGSRSAIQSLGHWRRSFHDTQSCGWIVIRSRYGLRGVRLGEARNPGPPRIFEQIRDLVVRRRARNGALNRARIGWGDPHGQAPEFGPRVRWHSRRTVFPGATVHHS